MSIQRYVNILIGAALSYLCCVRREQRHIHVLGGHEPVVTTSVLLGASGADAAVPRPYVLTNNAHFQAH
jgi:hypothetical protein